MSDYSLNCTPLGPITITNNNGNDINNNNNNSNNGNNNNNNNNFDSDVNQRIFLCIELEPRGRGVGSDLPKYPTEERTKNKKGKDET